VRVKRRRLKGFLKEYPEECLKLDGANLCLTRKRENLYNYELTKCIKYGKLKTYKRKPYIGWEPEEHERLSSKGKRYHAPECRLYSDGEWRPDLRALHVNWYRIEGVPSRWRRRGVGSKTYKLFEEYWKNRGVRDIQLRSLMEADTFWRKMGFHSLKCEKPWGTCRVGHPKDEYYRRGRWAGRPRRKEDVTSIATSKIKFLCGYKGEILGHKRGPDPVTISYVADSAVPNKNCVYPKVEPRTVPSWEERPKIQSSWLEQFKSYHRT